MENNNGKETHRLKIRRLRDTVAVCSCGDWKFTAAAGYWDTNEYLRQRIHFFFNLHLEGKC